MVHGRAGRNLDRHTIPREWPTFSSGIDSRCSIYAGTSRGYSVVEGAHVVHGQTPRRNRGF